MDGQSAGVDLSREDFASWFRHTRRTCFYCHLPEEMLAALALRTRLDRLLLRLGVDRLENEHPYRLGNIAMCCMTCNRIKSNVFSTAEMLDLGKSVSTTWERRLQIAGVLRPGQTIRRDDASFST